MKGKERAARRVLLTVSKSKCPWHKIFSILLGLLMSSLLVFQSIKKNVGFRYPEVSSKLAGDPNDVRCF